MTRLAEIVSILLFCLIVLALVDLIAAKPIDIDDMKTATTSKTTVSTKAAAKTTKTTTKATTTKKTTTKVVTTTSTTVETTAKPEPKPEPSYDVNANIDNNYYSLDSFRYHGVCYDGSGYRFTWYSETVLPGSGLDIPGRHVNSEGYVCDENGSICLASTELPKGTIVRIPFGNGIGVVYDKCCANEVTLDVYVN